MVSQMSVILATGRMVGMPGPRYLPERVPSGGVPGDVLCHVHPSTPPEGTGLPPSADIYWWPPKWVVRILQECFLV